MIQTTAISGRHMETKTLQFVKKRNYQAITKDRVVRLRYMVSEQGSDHALAYRDDLFYLHGGYGGAYPKIEAALEGLSVDAKVEVLLAPEEGYGERDAALVMDVPLDAIPEEARTVGTQLEGEAPNGDVRPFTVTAVNADGVTVDGNHPLAGKLLHFHLEVLDIRDATRAELDAGYAFGISG
jgi:FKBP-type peptidyl-prolyl cis-trans isomerase SlyD